IGVAISFGNVLLPGLIKLTFPFRIGLLTGLYAVCMNIFGALASGVSVPLSNINMLGWQGALGIWIVLTLVAIGVWMPQAKHPTSLPDYDSGEEKEKELLEVTDCMANHCFYGCSIFNVLYAFNLVARYFNN